MDIRNEGLSKHCLFIEEKLIITQIYVDDIIFVGMLALIVELFCLPDAIRVFEMRWLVNSHIFLFGFK